MSLRVQRMSFWSAFQQDLSEFVSTVTTETSTGLSSFFSDNQNTRDALTYEEKAKIGSELSHQKRTFSEEVKDDHLPRYEMFMEQFDLNQVEQEIDQFMTDESSPVSSFFEELVPSSLSSDVFWSRYFFKFMLALESQASEKRKIQEAMASLPPKGSSSKDRQRQACEDCREREIIIQSLQHKIQELEGEVEFWKARSLQQANTTKSSTSSSPSSSSSKTLPPSVSVTSLEEELGLEEEDGEKESKENEERSETASSYDMLPDSDLDEWINNV